LLRSLDLPADVVLDLPRLTIVGNLEFTLENHQGLAGFSPHELLIITRSGPIRLRGRDLVIDGVHEGEIRASGRFASLEFGSAEEDHG